MDITVADRSNDIQKRWFTHTEGTAGRRHLENTVNTSKTICKQYG